MVKNIETTRLYFRIPYFFSSKKQMITQKHEGKCRGVSAATARTHARDPDLFVSCLEATLS